MIYSVICTDTTDALHWQCELLDYTWGKYEQPGELLRLVACDPDAPLPEHRHARVVRTAFANVDPDSGDLYPPYNRLYSFKEWLDTENPDGTVLILDPDMVFRNSLKQEVKPGAPVGQQWVDFGMSARKKAVTAEISTVEFAQIQPVTWPALIHTDDLARLMPRWIELTAEYRKRTGGWEDDMFAFAVASAELGIVYSFGNVCAWPPWPEEKVAGAPIVHYCLPIKDQSGEVIWGKHRYKPWEAVENPKAASLSYSRDVLSLVDEYARLQRVSIKHPKETIFIAIAAYCDPELVSTIENCIDKAFHPENLRFGICLQYNNSEGIEMRDDCLDRYLDDKRFSFVKYDYKESRGGCWARNICQGFYQGETYTLQLDSHSRFIEGWDCILIGMLEELPSDKPLVTSFPPLYSRDEDGRVKLSHLNKLNRIPTTLAKTWNEQGWINHPHKYIPENSHFPRRTRFLSGAFVFTLGQWNEEVRQDPEHFYTGEEFALALRSYTQGYDLFDPSQIVVWHLSQPEPTRKYWHDNPKSATLKRHNKAVARLRILLKGDPDNELGRYGPGEVRTLEDYRIFSGLDCEKRSIHSDAKNGVPPDPVTIKEEFVPNSSSVAAGTLELTLYLDHIPPLELDCIADDPVLGVLFQAMFKNRYLEPQNNGDLIYLQIGERSPGALYFLSGQILAIETSPPMSPEFLSSIMDQVVRSAKALVPVFDDSWKFWIWNNVKRGCSKRDLFGTLLEKGFAYDDIRYELGYDPDFTAVQVKQASEPERPSVPGHFIPNAERIASESIELYVVRNYLSVAECEELVDTMKQDLVPSGTVADTDDHRKWRTSRTHHFKSGPGIDSAASRVHSRLCKLVGINPDYAESLQGHFYLPGEEYKPHCDWFDPRQDSYNKHAGPGQGGQRTWTMLVYLNGVAEGGGTRFVNIHETIEPERGKVVIWNNLLPSGQPNPDVSHHALPVVDGEKAVLSLWFRSHPRGEMFCREAGEEVPNYTQKGYKKITMPRKLFHKLNAFYHENSSTTTEESIPEFLSNENIENKVSDLVMLPRELKVEISHALKPTLEEWSNMALESTAVYGIRRYFRGARLKIHRDVGATHIISAILNIEQDVEIDWPLEIEDNYYRRHKITLAPGDMLLYEGARALHGRPTPLVGDQFCNVFVHFMPCSVEPATGDDIRV